MQPAIAKNSLKTEFSIKSQCNSVTSQCNVQGDSNLKQILNYQLSCTN